MSFQFNGVGFNVAHLATFTQEQFIKEFKNVHWLEVKETERVKMLKQAHDRIKKAAQEKP